MKLPTLACAVALMLLAPRALAAEWYVDAVNGSNANSGTSAADAWKTITYAIGQVGRAGPDTIHVLPGTYDAAHGEVFPLRLGNRMRLVGDLGPEATVIQGNGNMIEVDSTAGATLASTGAEGLTLRGGTSGVYCVAPTWTSGALQATFRDLVIESCKWGVYIDIRNVGEFSNHVWLEDLRISDCSQQCVSANGYEFNDFHVTMTGCVVSDAAFTGVLLGADYDSYGFLDLIQCTILANGARGVSIYGVQSGGATGVAWDCLVAGNGGDGVSLNSNGSFAITNCTIADNAGAGFFQGGHGATVASSILYGNADDLVPGAITVTDSNIGDGDFQGQNGNISVDPLFRDPANGDYRLGWGTGCVDATAGSSSPDLTGFPRGNDGDLDLTGAGDMGALELRTLDMPEALAIGQKLHIDYHAEVGQFGVLFLARTTQLPTPIATPFGDQWLPPGFLELVGMQKVLTPDPVRRTIVIPNSPALVGQQFSFQALSRSSNAPQGAAWTDAATVTFTL